MDNLNRDPRNKVDTPKELLLNIGIACGITLFAIIVILVLVTQ